MRAPGRFYRRELVVDQKYLTTFSTVPLSFRYIKHEAKDEHLLQHQYTNALTATTTHGGNIIGKPLGLSILKAVNTTNVSGPKRE